jgi:hypothetical protein
VEFVKRTVRDLEEGLVVAGKQWILDAIHMMVMFDVDMLRRVVLADGDERLCYLWVLNWLKMNDKKEEEERLGVHTAEVEMSNDYQ